MATRTTILSLILGILFVVSEHSHLQPSGYFDFEQVSQSGSHIKLRRVNISGDCQVLIIPNHKELSIGTL